MAKKDLIMDTEIEGATVVPQQQTVVQIVDPAIMKRTDDNERIKRLNAEFKKRLSSEVMITYKPPKFFADILSPIWAFTLNNYDVVVRFDGTPQKFPESIYKHLMNKLARVMDSNTQGGQIDEL